MMRGVETDARANQKLNTFHMASNSLVVEKKFAYKDMPSGVQQEGWIYI